MTCNLVVAGTWNVAIFSPQWSGKRFRELDGTETIQVEYATDHGGTRVRYSSEDLILTPLPDRLVVGFKELEDHILTKAEKLVLRILDDLPHTPVSGLGINFSFTEEDPGDELVEIFRSGDREKLAEMRYPILSTGLSHTLKCEPGVLNISLSFDQDQGNVSARLNFHHELSSAQEAPRIFGERALRCQSIAYDILETGYGMRKEDKS